MKVLLRDNETGHYFQGPSQWTLQPNEALDFFGTGQAMRAAKESQLRDAQVVLSFGDPRHDVVLPLAAGVF